MLQSPQRQFWFLIAMGSMAIIWLLKPMLLPFVAGFALAYFLTPAVDAISFKKMPRSIGTALVLLSFVLLAVLIAVLIFPILQNQLLSLIHALPEIIRETQNRIKPWADEWLGNLSSAEVSQIKSAAGQYAGNAVGLAGGLLKKIISGGFALFDVISLLVITPLVAFYLLRDWPKLTATTNALIPRKHETMIKEALSEINRTLSGFLRGQALVCLCLGLIYSVGLSLVGLKYGATIGIIAGFLSFIPYVGSTFGLVTSLILATIQFDLWSDIGMVALVFAVGQVLEGYVLTPKLVGDRVGLHPVWILFAIFAGGSLLGFTGILVAVPVAAVIGVLIRLSIKHYKTSKFYDNKKAP